jgi:hypothetical protein
LRNSQIAEPIGRADSLFGAALEGDGHFAPSLKKTRALRRAHWTIRARSAAAPRTLAIQRFLKRFFVRKYL